mmetsp:Transcript_43139/g.91971  ORF Transcript_43139/g.91971 Transcript_43139/m.91971 type:complete len:340 (+) Transcript_43139:499-1518(+)
MMEERSQPMGFRIFAPFCSRSFRTPIAFFSSSCESTAKLQEEGSASTSFPLSFSSCKRAATTPTFLRAFSMIQEVGSFISMMRASSSWRIWNATASGIKASGSLTASISIGASKSILPGPPRFSSSTCTKTFPHLLRTCARTQVKGISISAALPSRSRRMLKRTLEPTIFSNSRISFNGRFSASKPLWFSLSTRCFTVSFFTTSLSPGASLSWASASPSAPADAASPSALCSFRGLPLPLPMAFPEPTLMLSGNLPRSSFLISFCPLCAPLALASAAAAFRSATATFSRTKAMGSSTLAAASCKVFSTLRATFSSSLESGRATALRRSSCWSSPVLFSV